MTKADVPQVGQLLRRFLARFDVCQVFEKDEEVEHWFLSGQGKEENGQRVRQVTWAYVVEVGSTTYSSHGAGAYPRHQDPSTHLITDLVSFYSLPSSIMKSKKHDVLNAAYMFYYASDVIFSPGGSADAAETHELKAKRRLAERLNELVNDLLIVAKNVSSYIVLNYRTRG